MKTISASFKSQIKTGIRFTTRPEVAIEAAKGTGKKPIDYISPRVRDAYRKAYPELLLVVK